MFIMLKFSVIITFMLLSSFTCFMGKVSPFELVVAQDGSGNFTTISKALEATANDSTTFIYIKIKKGIYKENINVDSNKMNIVFIGDGAKNTIITGNRSRKSGCGTDASATVGVDGAGFVAKDITFENTAGPDAGQAVAFRSQGDKTAMYRCIFKGYQDTLYVQSNHQFYRDCEIYGTIDFIFGDSSTVLQNCKIYTRQHNTEIHTAVITAQGRNYTSNNTGISIQNCAIDREPGSSQNASTAYLGRPWKNYSRVVIMGSYIGDVVNPIGWHPWEMNDTSCSSLEKVYYAEYNNTGPSNNSAGRKDCLGCKAQVSLSEAQYFSVRQFIDGLSWIPNTGIPFLPDFFGH